MRNPASNEISVEWDRLLKIRTGGRDDTGSDSYRYPYEPTPYAVLERLANSGYIRKENTVLDYGCGKGRAVFFLGYQIRCHCLGVEYSERIFQAAVNNSRTAVSSSRAAFFNENAEEFRVPEQADRCWFFNPFSAEVLQKVLGRIRESLYESPREMLLFFYYPSDEYVSVLMTSDDLMFLDEIDCRDLFPGNDERERILIFET